MNIQIETNEYCGTKFLVKGNAIMADAHCRLNLNKQAWYLLY